MKQIVLCLIGILLASFVSAQKINHPSLLYTPQRIQQVKQRMQNEPKLREAWEDIQKTADEALQKKDFNRLDYLSLAYLMTDNKEYANIIKEILLKAVEAESWGDMEMMARIPVWRSQLGMAHKSFLSAIGYDAAYNIMSSSERKKIAEGSKRLAVEPALGDWLLEPARIHSLNSMGHNWWTSCVCQGGILALSLQNELPEVKDWVEQLHESLPEWFDFAGDALQQKAKSFDEAGGMYESLNYANFGIQEALLFRIAWINTHPGQNPGDIPQLAKLPNYFSQVCYPRTGMLYSLNFGDSHKNVSAESSMMLLYALGLKDPTNGRIIRRKLNILPKVKKSMNGEWKISWIKQQERLPIAVMEMAILHGKHMYTTRQPLSELPYCFIRRPERNVIWTMLFWQQTIQ